MTDEKILAIEERLETMDENWQAGKDLDPNVPEGVYTMQHVNAEFRIAQTSGKLFISRQFLIVGGEMEGRTVWDMMSYETDQGPFFINAWIELMGYESPDTGIEIKAILDAMNEANPVVKATLKRNNDFTNVLIDEVVEETSEVESVSETQPEEDPEVGETDDLETDWSAGDDVEWDDEESGEVLSGAIVEVRPPNPEEDETEPYAHVEDGNSDVWAVPVSDLRPAPVEAVESEPEPEPESAKKKPVKKTGGKPAQEKKMLLAIAGAYGIDDIDDTMDVFAIADEFKGYTWDAAEMIPEEIALLTSYDIAMDNVPKPKPEPKKPAKKVVKKAATAPKKAATTKKATKPAPKAKKPVKKVNKKS